MSLLAEDSPVPSKKPKATRACDVCRKKKGRCDGATPACSTCVAFGYECTFTYKHKKRGPTPSQVSLFSSRVERLETLLLPLVEEYRLKGRGKTRLLPESVNASHKEEVENDALSKLSQSLSNLALDEKPDFQYMGSSSGLYVLEGSKYNIDGLLPKNDSNLKIENNIPPVLLNHLLFQELNTRLLLIYFDRYHRYLPIFNKVDFQDRINSGKEVSLALLNSIYALVCRYTQRGDVFDDTETHTSVTNYFFTQAKTYLDREYLTPTVQTVQALILMSFQPEVGWIYSGMATQIGQELGLHRNLDLHKMDSVQKQNRQLTWWGCFFLDRLVSAIVGRPMFIDEEDCDVKLPMDIRCNGSNKNAREDEFAESVRYFKQIISLFTILTQTLRNVYGVVKQSKLKARDTLLHLNKSLSDWNATLLPEFWYDITLGRPNNQYVTMLALYYHYTVILTNRPYIASSGDNTSPLNILALQTCAKSASIISYILYHTPASCLLDEIQIKSTIIFSASTIHTMNIASADSNLAYASKANLVVNLNILKNLNIDSIVISLYSLLLADMIQSHGLSDMVSDSQQPVIYSPSNEQLSTADYMSSLPSRHDSESLLLRSEHMYINMSTATSENYPHLKTSSPPSVSFSSTYPLGNDELYKLFEPEVYSGGDIGNNHAFSDANTFHSSELAVNGTAVLGSDNEDSTNFDHEIWSVFVSMFNQSQLPEGTIEK